MKKKILPVAVFILILLLVACNAPLRTSTPVATPTPSATPTVTPTPVPPTPTPIPMAALVNGEGITLAEYQAELVRYQAGFSTDPGTNLATDWQKRVLQDLIDQTLLAQSAREKGFVLNEADLQARIDELAKQAGGAQALSDWMKAQGYSQEDFRIALARSAASAWMSDQITAAISWTADQVHARQILLYNSTDANNVLLQLNNGADFDTLAYQYDPATGGDLGWFPKGYLTERALESDAFRLEPGKYSEVIETPLGFHILFVIARDPQHQLTPDARMTLQENALSAWLEERRGKSEVQILVP